MPPGEIEAVHSDNPFSTTALGVYGVTILFYSVVYMVLMVLPFYALSQGEDNSSIGSIMGITMVASMFSRPFAGNLIDRYGSQKIFLSALAVFAVSLLGYFFQNYWVYWSVRLIQGCVAACFSTSMEIITIDLLSKRLRAQGLSLYSLATMLPTTFGPALSLYLMSFMTFSSLFLLFFLLGGVNYFFAIALSNRTNSLSHHSKGNASGGVLQFLLRKNLLLSSLIMMLGSIANGAIFVFLPLMLEQNESDLAPQYFLVQMVTLVTFRFLGRKYLPSDGNWAPLTTMGLCILICFGTMLIYVDQGWLCLFLAAICNGIGFALLYPCLLTYVSFAVEDSCRGLYLGLFIGAADLGFALGSLLMGPLADQFTLRTIFLFCAFFALFSIPLTLLIPKPKKVWNEN